MASTIVEAFSLSHAAILDGATKFVDAALGTTATTEALDVYGVNESKITPSLS